MKLSEEQVLEVLDALEEGRAQNEIAAELGVSPEAGGDIKNCRKWKHVGDESRRLKIASASARSGERNPRSKLAEADVYEVHYRKQAGESPESIAEDKGVAPSTVRRILSGKKWKQIYEEICAEQGELDSGGT